MKDRTLLPFLVIQACAPAESLLDGDESTTASVVELDTGEAGEGDSPSPEDTGQISDRAGNFDGEYSGWYELEIGLGEYSDICEGQVSITVDGEADVQVVGESECEFHGIAAEYLGLRDTYLSTVSGSIQDEARAGGSVWAEMGELEPILVPWEGVFEGGDELSANFSGRSTLDLDGYEVDVDFEGEFSVIR